MENSEKKELSFEQAMARLEEIITVLDSKQTTLDGSVKLYSESMELIAFCKGCLEEAEGKIQIIGKEDK